MKTVYARTYKALVELVNEEYPQYTILHMRRIQGRIMGIIGFTNVGSGGGDGQVDLSNYYTKSQTDTRLGNKLDKITDINKVYITNSKGIQGSISYSQNNEENTIPQRNKEGRLKASAGIDGEDTINFKQVIDTINDVSMSFRNNNNLN